MPRSKINKVTENQVKLTPVENFHDSLVLAKWLSKYCFKHSFQEIQGMLKPRERENGDGIQSEFYGVMQDIIRMENIAPRIFKDYDERISRFWKRIARERERQSSFPVKMLYFQYLMILATEVYLDNYFNSRDKMLDLLNEHLKERNRNASEANKFESYNEADLAKIAFWSATGSGKTLVMHVNLLQFMHYSKTTRTPVDTVILLTPNEGLSKQHLDDFQKSGIQAAFYGGGKHPELPGGEPFVEIIDVNKLGDEDGDKVVAVSIFEGRNLVLVDEGHRGTSKEAGTWLRRRDSICRGGFSMEYSATFGQAVAGGSNFKDQLEQTLKDRKKKDPDSELSPKDEANARREALREAYAKCIVFDYSYKFFYADGYGKNSRIVNLDSGRKKKGKSKNKANETHVQDYLSACLLSYYQQIYLWEKKPEVSRKFRIKKPLWVFVGSSVNPRTKSGEDYSKEEKLEASDVLDVIKFMARFLNDRDYHEKLIDRFLKDESVILDENNNNLLKGMWTDHLKGHKPREIYDAIVEKVFHSSSSQRLDVVRIKENSSEIGLRLGSGEFFGVIYIGAADEFARLCRENHDGLFDYDTSPFGRELFTDLTAEDSEDKLNVLIGARKFIEGWSCWRVSCMGLLNMGKQMGSQIIQLFGRGVRLQGYKFTLKRSDRVDFDEDDTIKPPDYLRFLETLNIFGVNADYIATFREYLSKEGIVTTERMVPIEVSTRHSINFRNLKLNTIKHNKDFQQKAVTDFKQNKLLTLFTYDKYEGQVREYPSTYDFVPRGSQTGTGVIGGENALQIKKIQFAHEQIALFNSDRIYAELVELKREKDWSNLVLDRQIIEKFYTENKNWYALNALSDSLEINSWDDLLRCEDIFISLIKAYAESYYEARKGAYEDKYLEYQPLKKDDDSFIQPTISRSRRKKRSIRRYSTTSSPSSSRIIL
jgi:hypothetical protein